MDIWRSAHLAFPNIVATDGMRDGQAPVCEIPFDPQACVQNFLFPLYYVAESRRAWANDGLYTKKFTFLSDAVHQMNRSFREGSSFSIGVSLALAIPIESYGNGWLRCVVEEDDYNFVDYKIQPPNRAEARWKALLQFEGRLLKGIEFLVAARFRQGIVTVDTEKLCFGRQAHSIWRLKHRKYRAAEMGFIHEKFTKHGSYNKITKSLIRNGTVRVGRMLDEASAEVDSLVLPLAWS